MATISAPTRPALPRSAPTRSDLQEADLEGRPQSPTTLNWGNSAPLAFGIIQLRTGNTFSGVLFTGFGGFWLSLFAVGQWFLKAVPAAQTGHALGLFLYAFGIFAVVMLVASLRTNAIVVLSIGILVAAFFLLAAGNYGAHPTMIHWGGYLGLAAAACAFYLALSELCEVSYERAIFPVGSLAKH